MKKWYLDEIIDSEEESIAVMRNDEDDEVKTYSFAPMTSSEIMSDIANDYIKEEEKWKK